MSGARLERAIWKSMVALEKLPFVSYARACPGQLTWTLINVELDKDERYLNVHTHCRGELDKRYCEVCHKPLPQSIDLSLLADEIRNEIWVPGDEVPTNLTDVEADAKVAEITAFLRAKGIEVKE